MTSSLQELMKSEPEVQHLMDDAEQTPLHSAARSGSAACVRTLLAAGSRIKPTAADAVAAEGEPAGRIASPLHSAAAAGRVDCLAILTQAAGAAGVSLDVVDSFGRTPLHLAAAAGATECVRALLAAGADADAQNVWGAVPLHFAVKQGRTATAVSMIGALADTAVADNQGVTPLHLAAGAGNVAIVKALIEQKADINVTGKRVGAPLALAVESNHVETSEALVTAGASLSCIQEHFAGSNKAAMDHGVRSAVLGCVRAISTAAVGSVQRCAAAEAAAGRLGAPVCMDVCDAILCKVFDVEESFLRLLLNTAAGSR
jgi:ankyrin repeat protein